MGVITFAIVKFVAWKPVKLRLQSNVADMVYYCEPIFFFFKDPTLEVKIKT